MNTLHLEFYKPVSRVCLLFLLILLSALQGCKKEKGDDPAPTGSATISMGGNEVKGYEIQTIEVEGEALLFDEYAINIGGKEVKAIKAMPGMLVFMLPPDLAAGKHNLTIPFASNKLEINYTAPDKIIDPAGVMNDFLGDVDAEYEAAIALTDDPRLLQKLKEQRDFQKEVPTRFAQLSDEEQQVAAQVILANKSVFDELDAALAELEEAMYLAMGDAGQPLAMALKSNGNCGYSCIARAVAKAFVSVALMSTLFTGTVTVGSVVAFTVGAILAINVMNGGKFPPRMVRVKDAISAFFDTLTFPQIKAVETQLDEFSDNLFQGVETKSGPSGLGILKGEPFGFRLQPTFRTLERTDAEHAQYGALIKPLIIAYDKAKAIYDTYFKEDYGAFPDFVKREERVPAKELSEWAVAVTQGTDVTVSQPVGNATDFSVVFNTTKAGEHPFEFTVTYDNGDFSTTEVFNGILVPQREPYKVEIEAGDNQRGQLGEWLPEPLKVVVKDVKGGLLADVDVQWRVKSGGGTLTEAVSKTNAEGVAQVEWQLGESGEQEVEVIVLNSDGDAVEGSPLVFVVQHSNIVGKWFIDAAIQYEYANGALIEVSEEHDYEPGSYFEFMADGTILVNLMNDGKGGGIYQLSEDGKTVTMRFDFDSDGVDESEEYTVLELSSQRMILHNPHIDERFEEETGSVHTWAIDIHFKK